ncbi:MAG: hypothetical protein OXC07_01655 [Kistimonas sp.]|nr:hypothetical protein [Kistimonas sp.]
MDSIQQLHGVVPLHDTSTGRMAATAPVRHQDRYVGPAAPCSSLGSTQQAVYDELPWFEQSMSQPQRDLSAVLRPHAGLRGTPYADILRTLQGTEGIGFFQRELERRKEMEARGLEYTFAPLLTSLDNMMSVTDNILAGLQFEWPLDKEDLAAFGVLKGRIDQLIKEGAPYKRTVQLALMMSCMQEIATVRYALPGLRMRAPALFNKAGAASSPRLKTFEFARRDADGASCRLEAKDIPLSLVLSCAWGQLKSGGADEKTLLLADWGPDYQRIFQWLDSPELILYPSFEYLDPRDFCCLGHLPFYPLGMTSVHAVNADGLMRTPLDFFAHDVVHTNQVRQPFSFAPDSTHPLEGVSNRFRFRQLVMNLVPASLREHQLDLALALILFNLFHEETSSGGRKYLETDSMTRLLYRISFLRRERTLDYPSCYQTITDWQALLACLWVHRLARHYPDLAAPVSDGKIGQLAEDFARTDMASLQAHWTFLQTHWQAVHQYFMSDGETRVMNDAPDGGKWYDHRFQNPHDPHFVGGFVMVKEDYNCSSERAVDNTDLAYFYALFDPVERQKIERATGQPLPPGAL